MLNDASKSGEEIIDAQNNENVELSLTSCSQEDFLKIICNYRSLAAYSEKTISASVEELNKNKEKIKNMVNCILLLDKQKITDLLPKHGYSNFDKLDFLLQHKTYMILCLIEFGINPFEIKKCLELNSKTDFNWNGFLGVIEDYREKWFYAFHDDAMCICNSIVIVELINVFGGLLNPKNNSNQVNIKTAIDIFAYYRLGGFLRFIWFYLNKDIPETKETQAMKQFLLGIPGGVIFTNFFDPEDKNVVSEDGNKKELDLSDMKYGHIGNTDFQSNFCDWIKNLDQVMIGVFCLILMRNISFTNEQMNFIASKVNNNSVMTTLRQINQSLDYKNVVDRWYCNGKGNSRRVEFGPITHGLDYAFVKIFRGIGYLGALLWMFLHFIPRVIFGSVPGFIVACCLAFSEFTSYGYGIFFFWSTPFWISFGVVALIFTILFSIQYVFSNDFEISSWYHDFPDDMQDFYNESKVVYLLELYNIKHPINNVKLPPQQMNINYPNNSTVNRIDLLKSKVEIYDNNSTNISQVSGNKNEISESIKSNP